MSPPRITFIGGGNMCSALLGGLLSDAVPAEHFAVVEVAAETRQRLTERYGIRVFSQMESDAVAQAQAIVLAVKPQQMKIAAQSVAPFLSRQLVISIAAGIRSRALSQWLNDYRFIVRAMPNTPALVKAGMSGLYALSEVSSEQRHLAETILSAVGAVLWCENEAWLDAITALSGSGPAYVFYFLEAFEQAAQELGLPKQAARQLAYATFSGAIKLATQSDTDPATLREQVTSKGGTTERALAVLETEQVKASIVAAIKAAALRARQLGDDMDQTEQMEQ